MCPPGHRHHTRVTGDSTCDSRVLYSAWLIRNNSFFAIYTALLLIQVFQYFQMGHLSANLPGCQSTCIQGICILGHVSQVGLEDGACLDPCPPGASVWRRLVLFWSTIEGHLCGEFPWQVPGGERREEGRRDAKLFLAKVGTQHKGRTRSRSSDGWGEKDPSAAHLPLRPG